MNKPLWLYLGWSIFATCFGRGGANLPHMKLEV